MNIREEINQRLGSAPSAPATEQSGPRRYEASSLERQLPRSRQGEARIKARAIIQGLDMAGVFANYVNSVADLAAAAPGRVKKFLLYSDPAYAKVAAERAKRALVAQAAQNAKIRGSVARASGSGQAVIDAIEQGSLDEALLAGLDFETRLNDPAYKAEMTLQSLLQGNQLGAGFIDIMGGVVGGQIGQMSATTPPQRQNMLAGALGAILGAVNPASLFRSGGGGGGGGGASLGTGYAPALIMRGGGLALDNTNYGNLY